MSLRTCILGSVASFAAVARVQAVPIVLVTGATGGTGAQVYKQLKQDPDFEVRAFVRNATKAKSVLGCDKCDESEGVFVGDLKNKESVLNAMHRVDKLVIATAAVVKCTGAIPIPPLGSCSYPKGGAPIDIDWQGTKMQVEALGNATKSAGSNISSKQIAYVSAGGTETPNSFFDKIGNGHIAFYKVNAEAYIMNSGFPFTIAKPCGLGDGLPGKNKLIVGHDGEGYNLAISHTIQRSDVARVLVESLRNPVAGAGLRFDLCSQFLGKPTTDIATDIFQAAMYPWDPRKPREAKTMTVV